MIYSMNKSITTIKIPIKSSKENKEFVFKNSNYSRFVWNKFVELLNGKSVLDINLKEIDEIKKSFYYGYEIVNDVYSTMVVGISEQIAKNMKYSLKAIKSVYYDTGKLGQFRFHSIDKYRCSFKVNNRPNQTSDTTFNSRLKILGNRKVAFRVRSGEFKEFELKEDLYNRIKTNKSHDNTYYNEKRGYKFKDSDIKEIIFYHNCGRLYILLITEVRFVIHEEDITKDGIAGIDLGIHNPCVLYDGKKFYKFKMDEKTLFKIHKLEKRIRMLRDRMARKMKINRERVLKGELKSVYTKNFEKVRNKYRITHRKMANIKNDWRKKICVDITRKYKIISVDDFKSPTKHETQNKRLIGLYIKINTFYGMFYFSRTLIHQCNKNNSTYIDPMYDLNSTNTCSKCGHINAKKMSLSNRIFKCEKCEFTLDRDENSAINLYTYIHNVI